MSKEFEDFLKYGMDGEISKRQLIETDFLVMFLGIIAAAISGFSVQICTIAAIVWILLIFLTYSKTTVTGIGIFWIHSIWAVSLTVIFAIFGTTAMLYVIEKKDYPVFVVCVVIGYLLLIGLYIGILVYLIKKGAYNKTGKTNGVVISTIFGAAGLAFAKTFLKDLDNQEGWRCIAICGYLLSALSMMGFVNFIKYYFLKKLTNSKDI